MSNSAEDFKQRYLGFHAKLYRIAYALTKNKEMAEDVVQDCYLKLWQQRDKLKMVNNVEAFCVTLIKNKCLDVLRSTTTKKQNHSIETINNESLLTSEDNRNDEHETVKQVLSLMNKLPENQQLVLRLQAIEQCSIQEIETITGFSNTNIRSYLSRGRKQLRQLFLKKDFMKKGGWE